MKLIVFRQGVKDPREFLVTEEMKNTFISECCNPMEYTSITVISTDGEKHVFSKNDIVGYEVEEN